MTDPRLVALEAKRTRPPKRAYRHGRPVCRYCGADLGAIARGRGACDAPECRKKDRELRDKLRRERDEIDVEAMRVAAARAVIEERRQIERLRAETARGVSEIEPPVPAVCVDEIAVTCHTSTPLVDLPPDMVQNFRDRLMILLRAQFEEQDERRAQGGVILTEDDGTSIDKDGVTLADLLFRTFEQREELEKPAPAAEVAGCAACRGKCCESGFQNLAYIRPADVARFRARNPDATPESMIETLFAHLPDRHIQYSCVFHGVFGCTLPRDLRANMCNGYKCEWLLKIEALVDQGKPPRLVAGFEKNRPLSAFFVGDDGALTELPVDSSISSCDLMAEAAEVARGVRVVTMQDQTSLPDGPDGGSTESSTGGTGS